ncbi:hypothetical protein AAF712_011931 [Marasmius tenuissimus]|uniref:CxC5 like cysteine cluster associated with KDZ domain-containing protein n=1 Tax=Marasmius tenuissimus TaxID=585030 RepID=A0ABR2ZIX8_9AGAR
MDRITIGDLTQLDLPGSLSLSKLATYFRICQFLRREITVYSKVSSSQNPPVALPPHVVSFLSSILNVSEPYVTDLWVTLGVFIWDEGEMELEKQDAVFFERHGKLDSSQHKHLAAFMFYPPHFSCLKCGRGLTRLSRVPITLFSLHGAHDGYSTSLRCPVCPIRYYPQYYTDTDVEKRFYYSSTPSTYIHLEQSTFITTALAELFTMWMLFAWVSSLNSANIYNHAMSALPPELIGQSRYTLTSEQVWRTFVLHALFRHASQYNSVLTMSEAPGVDHDLRLKEVQSLRNILMDRHGQPERLHACNICEKLIPTDLPDAYLGLRPLRAVVVDGVSIGRPCCKIHNCPAPLITNRTHYCAFHNETHHNHCVVTECVEKVRPGYQTCGHPDHVAIEAHHKLKGKSFFMLRKRLLRANGVPDDNNEESDEVLELGPESSHKSDLGNRQVKARFGRRRTHNEQLIVCCCGVIAARATMFGAEAISGVKVFVLYSLDVTALISYN